MPTQSLTASSSTPSIFALPDGSPYAEHETTELGRRHLAVVASPLWEPETAEVLTETHVVPSCRQSSVKS